MQRLPVRTRPVVRWRPPEHGDAAADRQEDRAGDQREIRFGDPSDHALTRTRPVRRGSDSGIRLTAGAVLLMRILRIAVALVRPAPTGGAMALTGGAMLAAPGVERTDVPRPCVPRVTVDPRIVALDAPF